MFCLTTATDPAWATLAAERLDLVLIDHAHCEMKAASSALALAGRAVFAPSIVRPLVALAQEELAHFDRVLAELERRGLELGAPPVDDYAAALLRHVTGPKAGRERMVDRLLAGALIEARSCERFKLLTEALGGRGLDDEAAFYRELLASEARHYTVLRQLAIDVGGDEPRTLARLAELAQIEGAINADLGRVAAIHG
ncbi:MAG: tRNA-(ms[2]io[6]A)-hydroxylase [Deltaproteobacteria bacterium]|nr:tRNA-(ms[2]io[6]A)-hydroxylase [Deltaproteobacteria bacterium]